MSVPAAAPAVEGSLERKKQAKALVIEPIQNQSNAPREINLRRWDEVRESIRRASRTMAQDLVGQAGKRENDWRNTQQLHELLVRLDQFANEGIEWLYDEGNVSTDSYIVNRYPPQYARNLIMQQALHDFRVIWHVHLQRRDDIHDLRPATDVLESVARHALQPAMTAGFLDESLKVIVYLQKSPSIRIMPYANVALIGLPYWLSKLRSSTPESDLLLNDLLAVPHEIGHYVYWRGKVNGSDGTRHTLARQIKHYVMNTFADLVERDPKTGAMVEKPTLTILKRWSEEIFADLYGLMFAGPASVVSLCEAELDHHWLEPMFDTHDDHPAPLLRPQTMLAVLDKSGDATTRLALQRNWQQHTLIASLQDNPAVQRQIYPELESQLKQLAVWIYGLFKQTPGQVLSQQFSGLASGSAKNTGVMPESAVPLNLMTDWRKKAAALIATKPAAVDGSFGERLRWETWVDWLRQEYAKLELVSYAKTDKDVRWIVAMSAGGWTEGPTNGGSRPV